MHSRQLGLSAIAICLVVTAIGAASASAGPGTERAGGLTDSRIVWARSDAKFTRQQIVSARPDGSGRFQLSHPKKKFADNDPSISPDGTQVIYQRDPPTDPARGGPPPEFIVVGADGHNEQILDLGCVDPCFFDATPTWTPTPGRIAYTPLVGPFDAPHGSARSGALQTSGLDGADPIRLSEPGIDGLYEDYYARYSPDGSYIVFTRVSDKALVAAALRMNADGTDVRRLTPWGLDADLADLSPATSGKTEDLVVFETVRGPKHNETTNLATVPATCTSVSECRKRIDYLTAYKHGPIAAFNPAWSPNGKRIAYTKFKAGDDCCVGDIYTMRADGSHRRAVSKSPLFEYRPDWGVAP